MKLVMTIKKNIWYALVPMLLSITFSDLSFAHDEKIQSSDKNIVASLVHRNMLNEPIHHATDGFIKGIGNQPKHDLCRRGAFTNPMAQLNAAVRASRALMESGAAKTDRVRLRIALAELDEVLILSIEQATSEYVCARGTLVMGYDKNFSDNARRALAHARSRHLSENVVSKARSLAESIETSGAPVPPHASVSNTK
jgi:hypothetical protein